MSGTLDPPANLTLLPMIIHNNTQCVLVRTYTELWGKHDLAEDVDDDVLPIVDYTQLYQVSPQTMVVHVLLI